MKQVVLKVKLFVNQVNKQLFHICLRTLSLGFSSKIPQRNVAMGYCSYILTGFICLLLPIAQKHHISFIDNLFMITSAVSTTGLATVDISSSYTIFGQFILLFFIQLGGIGYMTLSSYMMYNMTHHFVKIKANTAKHTLSIPDEHDLSTIINSAVKFTLVFETFGILLLYIFFRNAGVTNPMWNAIFHSISSFCTAGFSLFSDSMIQFRSNIGVNVTIAILSYAGAMGFVFITDIYNKIKFPKSKISFTSKVILYITTAITFIVSIAIYFNLSPNQYTNNGDRLMISVFQTMSAMTTVGFNSVDIGIFRSIPMLLLIVVMFVGASPSGTGGGVKSTTISAIYAFLKCKLSEQRDVYIGLNRLPSFRVDSAITNFIFYQIILFIGVVILLCTDNFSLESTLFEVTSALSTVGLSTGITPSLSICGKIVLILLMYIGRLGVLVFGAFMLIRMDKKTNQLKQQDIAI